MSPKADAYAQNRRGVYRLYTGNIQPVYELYTGCIHIMTLYRQGSMLVCRYDVAWYAVVSGHGGIA